MDVMVTFREKPVRAPILHIGASGRKPNAARTSVAKGCLKMYFATMAKVRKVPVLRKSSANRTGMKIPVTLRLDAERFKRLQILARAENRTVTNFVETAVLRDMEAKEEAARVITMFVPPEAAALTPGKLLRTEGESDERYAERSALMDRLFAIPHNA
jgi:hypothetical protein